MKSKMVAFLFVVSAFAFLCCLLLYLELFGGGAFSWLDTVDPPEFVEVPIVYVPLMR